MAWPMDIVGLGRLRSGLCGWEHPLPAAARIGTGRGTSSARWHVAGAGGHRDGRHRRREVDTRLGNL